MNHDDDLGPITDEERAEAEALRRALEREDDPAPGSAAAFATAVRVSMKGAQPALSAESQRSAVQAAIAHGSRRARRRTMGTLLAIAAAAVLGVVVPAALSLGGDTPAPTLTYGGPTDDVFDAPFEETQRASERMDRIAVARAHDYFAALGDEQR